METISEPSALFRHVLHADILHAGASPMDHKEKPAHHRVDGLPCLNLATTYSPANAVPSAQKA